MYVTYSLFQALMHSLDNCFFAAVSSGASQTDNTGDVVGGVTVAVVLIVAMTIIAIVALLRLRCSLPARAPVQYVYIMHIIMYVSNLTTISLCSTVQGTYDFSTILHQ